MRRSLTLTTYNIPRELDVWLRDKNHVEVLLIVLEPVEGDIVGIVRGVTWSCSHAILFDIDRWCKKKMAAL